MGKNQMLSLTKKEHKMSLWDCKIGTFPDHNEDQQTFGSTYKISFITITGRALFEYFVTAKAEAKKKGTPFNENINEWVLKPAVEEGEVDDGVGLQKKEIEAIEKHFKLQSQGNSIAKLSVMKTQVLMDTFKVVDSKKFKDLQYDTELDFKEAMQSALKENLLDIAKFWIDKTRDVCFPKGKKENDLPHKQVLKALLFDPFITKILKGFIPDNVVHWFIKPWLNPAVQLWFRILMKYEGVSEKVDSNFIDEFIETTNMGKKASSNTKINIKEVDRRIQLQMESAAKAFTTVDDFCRHLRLCALTTIIKDLAKAPGMEGEAWKMADNRLVAVKALKAETERITLADLEQGAPDE
eukprot:2089465-Rhodomonas_salina.1